MSLAQQRETATGLALTIERLTRSRPPRMKKRLKSPVYMPSATFCLNASR